jgi:hypothetical protein
VLRLWLIGEFVPDDVPPLGFDDLPFADDIDTPRPSATDPVPRDEPTDASAGAVDDVWTVGLGDPGDGAEAPSSHTVADEWVRPQGQSSSLLLLMGFVILFMIGIVVFLALNSKDDPKASDPAITTAASADPGAGTPKPTAVDPGSDPDLDVQGAATDNFDRPGPELGTFPGHGPWTNLVGTIEIEKGVARTADIDPKANLQLATVDAGSADVSVEVKLPSPVDRAGVAVRVASADRFIGLFATSDYGTYTLARFNNGKLDPDDIIGNADLTGVSVGDVIGIRAKGSKVEILTNGTVRNSFDDPKLEIEGTGVGMFAVRDESGPKPVDAREFANWDDFTFLAAG